MRKKLAKRKKREKRFSRHTAIIFGVLFLTAICFLPVKIEYTRTGYEISRNQETEKQLIKEGQILNYELSKLKSPEFLEPVAKKMGFRFATYKDVVFVEEVVLAGRAE